LVKCRGKTSAPGGVTGETVSHLEKKASNRKEIFVCRGTTRGNTWLPNNRPQKRTPLSRNDLDGESPCMRTRTGRGAQRGERTGVLGREKRTVE